MKLPQQFWDDLPQKTDLELYEMLCRPTVYLPEALAAAKMELAKRGKLTVESFTELAAAATTERERIRQVEAHDRDKRRLAVTICHIFGFTR